MKRLLIVICSLMLLASTSFAEIKLNGDSEPGFTALGKIVAYYYTNNMFGTKGLSLTLNIEPGTFSILDGYKKDTSKANQHVTFTKEDISVGASMIPSMGKIVTITVYDQNKKSFNIRVMEE